MAKWKMVRADYATWEALQEMAERQGKSITQLLRELVKDRTTAPTTIDSRPTYTTGLSELEQAAKQETKLEKDWQFWEIYHTLQAYFQKCKDEAEWLRVLREKRIGEGAHPKVIEYLDKQIAYFEKFGEEIKTLDQFIDHLIEFWRETMQCPNTAEKLRDIWERTQRWLQGMSSEQSSS
jgi:hypothetical protein